MFLLLAASPALAGERHYTGHELVGQSLTVTAGETRVRLTPYAEGALEVSYERDDVKQLPSYAIGSDPLPVEVELTVEDDRLVYATPGIRAVIRKSPLGIAYYRGDTAILEEEAGFFAHDALRGFRFRLADDEKLLGGGQRVLGMDRRGHRIPLDNRPAYGYTTEAPQMYYSLPAVLSTRKYIVVFDNSARGYLDLGHGERDILQFEAVGGRTSYLVFAAETYPALIEQYVSVTGRQPLPPRWAFGNYASRFGYRSEAEVRETVARFIEEDIPVDAVVLDIYWFGPDIQGHMGNLDWDRDAFPDPAGMMRDLEADGVRTVLITEPFVLTTSKRWAEAVKRGVLASDLAGKAKRFDFYFGNTGLIDVFDERAGRWFWSILEALMEQGVDGWWGDLGEPEVHPADTVHVNGTADEVHNAYGHAWAEAVFRGHEAAYPDRRPFIMMRSGFAGSQRYGMIPWTGDVSRSWGGLKPQVELALSGGLLGLGYMHSDLGGFAGGERFDRELYIRWLQYGVFQPVYRPHAQEHIAPEPVFHDRRTKDIVRRFVKLRYRLLPYVYTLAWENATTGMPLMRPLFFEDENDASLVDETGTFLWGDAFLVSPVVEPGLRRQSVRLPAGAWFDFWTGERLEGGRTTDVRVGLETIPVYVRAGAFVPMTGDIRTTRDYSSESLTLHYYADPSVQRSAGRMYEDDGHTHRAIERGLHELLYFSAASTPDGLDITLRRDGGSYPGMPRERRIELVVHNAGPVIRDVRAGGRGVGIAARRGDYESGAADAWFDARASILRVRLTWDHRPLTVAIAGREGADAEDGR